MGQVAAPRMISCVLALATLTLGACSSGPTLTGGRPSVSGVAGGDAPGTAADPASPSQSPAPSALTPELYKSELKSGHDGVRDALKSMLAARTVKTLGQRVGGAQRALVGAADGLDAVVPPVEVAAQHEAYVTGLRDVAARLDFAREKVAAWNLCTPSAVLTDLGAALTTLDKAGEALEEAGDYPADVVSAKAAKKQNRRLGNGHFLRKGGLGGRSSLQIHNGGTSDAVVNVMRGKSKVMSVYVRRKAKFKINSVRDGNYRIYFTHGVDWDRKSRAFTRECSFERFQKPVKFKTTVTATQILWHDWRITLHAISGGNARTSKVNPEDFPN